MWVSRLRWRSVNHRLVWELGLALSHFTLCCLDPWLLTAGKSLLPCAAGISWSYFSSWSTWQSRAARSCQQFNAVLLLLCCPEQYLVLLQPRAELCLSASPRGFIELLWKSLLVVFIYTCNSWSQVCLFWFFLINAYIQVLNNTGVLLFCFVRLFSFCLWKTSIPLRVIRCYYTEHNIG